MRTKRDMEGTPQDAPGRLKHATTRRRQTSTATPTGATLIVDTLIAAAAAAADPTVAVPRHIITARRHHSKGSNSNRDHVSVRDPRRGDISVAHNNNGIRPKEVASLATNITKSRDKLRIISRIMQKLCSHYHIHVNK